MSLFARRPVGNSPDLARVAALPRRTWTPGDEYVERLSAVLRRRPGARLRPVQAQALTEIIEHRGLLAPIGCGYGKTLISLLAPVVLGAIRPLVVMPSKLIEKTLAELPGYREDWYIPDRMNFLAYEKFSRDGAYLDALQPDLLVFDEGHRLKAHTAAVTRRVRRHIRERRDRGDALVVVVLTGTLTSRSLRDYAHLAEWALGHGSPCPLAEMTVRDWADALDEKVDPRSRNHPGALLRLSERPMLTEELSDVRRMYWARVIDTPGVVATSDAYEASGLEIRQFDVTYAPSTALRRVPCLACEGAGCERCETGYLEFADGVDGAFDQLRRAHQTPDGTPVPDAANEWRHARELSCGFYYRLNPPPPERWRRARSDWFRFVQEDLSRNRSGRDSMADVARAFPSDPRLLAWLAVRDEYDPDAHREAVWLDATVLTHAARWALEAPGLVWVEHIAVGERLAQLTGLPYCSEGGCDRRGVQACAQDPSRSVICSYSIGEGQNMQAWHRNLILSFPPNGLRWEQMLARTHREGQRNANVTVDMLVSCSEVYEGFQQALADAEYQCQPRRLLQANISLVHPEPGLARWAMKEE